MPRIASRPHRAAKIANRIAEGARETGRVVGGAVDETIAEARGQRPKKDLTKQVGEFKLLVIGLIVLVVLTSGIWVWPYFFARQVVGQAQMLAAQAGQEQRSLQHQQEQERRKADLAAQAAQAAYSDDRRAETSRRDHEAGVLRDQQRTREIVGPKLPPLRALRAEVVRAHSHAGMDAADAREVATMLTMVEMAIKGCDNAMRTGKHDDFNPTHVPTAQYRARIAALSTKYQWDAPLPDALAGNATGTTLFKIEQLLLRVEPKLAKAGARAPAAAVAAVAAAKAAAAEATGKAAAEVDLDVLQARLDELRNASDEIDLLE